MITRFRKTIGVIAIIVLTYGLWVGYNMLYTWRHLPEAYAAWDTGTLLVEYLNAHDNHWPTSWDDLLTTLDTPRGREITLHGASAGDMEYTRSLRDKVAVDWNFDPSQVADAAPVTRPDGSAFPVLWQGADPNEMVRECIKSSANSERQ